MEYNNIKTLYAWVHPTIIAGSLFDHTWVTDFNTLDIQYQTIDDVVKNNKNFWYCWGDYLTHGKPESYIGEQQANLSLAKCLASSNVDTHDSNAAKGTIFKYGINGVCHQLANQILYSTSINSQQPLTVKDARGYHASSFIYGDYGIPKSNWDNKKSACDQTKTYDTIEDKYKVSFKLDSFEKHLRKILEDESELLISKLLSLREEIAKSVHDTMNISNISADKINSKNQIFFDEATKILPKDKFKQIFGFLPNEPINLVDPKIFQKSKNK